MTVLLKSPYELETKLPLILDKAKERGDNHIVLLTQSLWHMEAFDWFLKHGKISRLKIKGDTIFMIKEMRVELTPIAFKI